MRIYSKNIDNLPKYSKYIIQKVNPESSKDTGLEGWVNCESDFHTTNPTNEQKDISVNKNNISNASDSNNIDTLNGNSINRNNINYREIFISILLILLVALSSIIKQYVKIAKVGNINKDTEFLVNFDNNDALIERTHLIILDITDASDYESNIEQITSLFKEELDQSNLDPVAFNDIKILVGFYLAYKCIFKYSYSKIGIVLYNGNPNVANNERFVSIFKNNDGEHYWEKCDKISVSLLHKLFRKIEINSDSKTDFREILNGIGVYSKSMDKDMDLTIISDFHPQTKTGSIPSIKKNHNAAILNLSSNDNLKKLNLICAPPNSNKNNNQQVENEIQKTIEAIKNNTDWKVVNQVEDLFNNNIVDRLDATLNYVIRESGVLYFFKNETGLVSQPYRVSNPNLGTDQIINIGLYNKKAKDNESFFLTVYKSFNKNKEHTKTNTKLTKNNYVQLHQIVCDDYDSFVLKTDYDLRNQKNLYLDIINKKEQKTKRLYLKEFDEELRIQKREFIVDVIFFIILMFLALGILFLHIKKSSSVTNKKTVFYLASIVTLIIVSVSLYVLKFRLIHIGIFCLVVSSLVVFIKVRKKSVKHRKY